MAFTVRGGPIESTFGSPCLISTRIFWPQCGGVQGERRFGLVEVPEDNSQASFRLFGTRVMIASPANRSNGWYSKRLRRARTRQPSLAIVLR
jgi:hypothetical protein